jgi:hypothetical protein
MRRAGNLFEQVVDRENLRLAVSKALRGKRSRSDARQFVAALDEHLDWMRSALVRGDFPLGVYHQFTIFDPKERLITAPCFRERVLHHAVTNVCEPVFERWLIADSFACRRGKGRLAALSRARSFAARFPFFLKLDIRKYFASISHQILSEKLVRLFKDRCLLDLLSRIITGFESSPGRGLPIGSLTSQHLANFYLGWFDRFVKEPLRVKGYVRYMNDCALWGESAAELRGCLDASRVFLSAQLGLDLKADPYINRSEHGLDFLGCRVFPSRILLNRRSRIRFRRRLRALEEAYLAGQIDELQLQQRVTALVAFTRTPGLSSWGSGGRC